MADGVNRPMTGIRGAGYPGTAAGGGSANRRGVFDPLNQAVKSAGSGGSPAGLDNSKREETPEDKIKSLEKKVDIFEFVRRWRLIIYFEYLYVTSNCHKFCIFNS